MHGSISGEYRALPGRRVNTKPDGAKRPLAVAALRKDRQRDDERTVNAIYEEDSSVQLRVPAGARHARALDASVSGIEAQEGELHTFFVLTPTYGCLRRDEQKEAIRFVEHRCDKRIIRMI